MSTWPTIPADVLAALPEHASCEQEWQNALRLALPRVLPVTLHRQIPGRHKVEGGSWMTGAPVGAADLTGYVVGPGTRVEIECKMEGAARTIAQSRWARETAAAGCIYMLAVYEDMAGMVLCVRATARALRRLLVARGVDLTIAGPRRGRGRG